MYTIKEQGNMEAVMMKAGELVNVFANDIFIARIDGVEDGWEVYGKHFDRMNQAIQYVFDLHDMESADTEEAADVEEAVEEAADVDAVAEVVWNAINRGLDDLLAPAEEEEQVYNELAREITDNHCYTGYIELACFVTVTQDGLDAAYLEFDDERGSWSVVIDGGDDEDIYIGSFENAYLAFCEAVVALEGE